jgi:acyl-CoA synthetase (AMP-forming)/AMP-acid ligase II
VFRLVERAKDLYGRDTYMIAAEPGLGEFSFRDLYDFTVKYADYLDEQGTKAGGGVASVFHNSTLAALLFVSTIAARRVYVPLNPKMGESEIAHVLAQTVPAVTIHHGEFGARLRTVPGTGALIAVPDEVAFIEAIMARPLPAGAAPGAGEDELDHPAEVVFTSGSTGLPKGAVLTHRNLLRNSYALTLAFGFGRSSRFLTACPLFHNSGQIFSTLTALWCGATHIAVRSDFAMLRFWDIVDRYELEWTVVMNAFLALLMQRPEMPRKNTMKGVLSGGSKLKLDLIDDFEKRFGVPVYQCFGLTETTSISTVELPGRTRASRGSAGKPVPGCEIRIVDGGADVPQGERGEILIAGEHLFSHYLNLPDVTAEKMSGGWLHSGDLGYLDEEGNLFIVDRLDSMIHVGGENVYPSEIENLSVLLDGVEEVVVTAIPDKILGAELVLVYKARDGYAPDPASWTAMLAKHVSTFKIPKRRVAVEELGLDTIPRAANGKLLRGEIQRAVRQKLAVAR